MENKNRRIAALRIGLAALLLGACYGDPPGPDPDATVDEAAILSTLPRHEASPAFVRLNQAAYTTALASHALINVYVTSHAFAPYASIVPESDGSGVEVPEGTLIVRSVLDDQNAVKALTIMYKGPAGYNPEIGDYWFAVTDAKGVPLVEDGQKQLGRLEACYGCHLERAGDDFLFGVPAVMRTHLSQ